MKNESVCEKCKSRAATHLLLGLSNLHVCIVCYSRDWLKLPGLSLALDPIATAPHAGAERYEHNIMTTFVKLNGTVLACSEDDGNFWIKKTKENAHALGLEWIEESQSTKTGGFLFGSCIVGPNGNKREARENSLAFYCRENGAEIEIVRVELEPHEIAENVTQWRESQARKLKRAIGAAFKRGFNSFSDALPS